MSRQPWQDKYERDTAIYYEAREQRREIERNRRAMKSGKWLPEDAAAVLAKEGIVWSIGQLTREAIRHLDRIGHRERAMWPWYHVGTIKKTCWTRK